MDLLNIARAALRAWYVTLIVFALSMAVSLAYINGVEVEYEAEAAMLLVGPTPGEDDPVNPLAEGGVDTLALATEVSVGSPATRAEISAAGLEPTYSIQAVNREPLLEISVASTDADVAVATVDAVIVTIETDLFDRQAEIDVPLDQLIRTQVLSVDEVAVENSRGRARAAIALTALSALVAVLAANLFVVVRDRFTTEARPVDDRLPEDR